MLSLLLSWLPLLLEGASSLPPLGLLLCWPLLLLFLRLFFFSPFDFPFADGGVVADFVLGFVAAVVLVAAEGDDEAATVAATRCRSAV